MLPNLSRLELRDEEVAVGMDYPSGSPTPFYGAQAVGLDPPRSRVFRQNSDSGGMPPWGTIGDNNTLLRRSSPERAEAVEKLFANVDPASFD